jgi:hypothetical protein
MRFAGSLFEASANRAEEFRAAFGGGHVVARTALATAANTSGLVGNQSGSAGLASVNP